MKAGQDREQARSMAKEGQERGRILAGAVQEWSKSRAGAEEGQEQEPNISPIQDFIQIGCKT